MSTSQCLYQTFKGKQSNI